MTLPFGPWPTSLSNAIQENYIERAFVESLRPVLVYRHIADREIFPGRIGQSITKTRMGLMVPNTTPLNPSTNTNLDNGMTPQNYSDEQYTLSIAQYPQLAPDINLPDDEVTIASFAMRNAINLAIAQASCLDFLIRNSLFNAYMGGNTVITQTLGAPATTVNVDDTRGFQTTIVNGNVVPVSVSNPLAVTINGTAYSVTGYANDVSNVSSAATTGGTSGTLTTSANVSTTNGTAGKRVLAGNAPLIVRPNNRASTDLIQASDLLNMSSILAAVAYMRNNAVPTVNGRYNLYLDATSMNQLFADPEFQILTRGVGTRDSDYQEAWVYEFLDVRFIQTTQAFIQPPQAGAPVPVAQTIHRPILCGQGCVIESIFGKGMDAIKNTAERGTVGDVEQMIAMRNPFNINVFQKDALMDGFYMYIRHPLDRLGQIISQTSNYIGGFVVPTDVTTNSTIIPTASSAAYKRCVIFETA